MVRCFGCGGQMHLVQVEDDAMRARGYEQQTFECSSCHEVEHRLVFNERKTAIRRN
jgi:transposase